MGFNPLTFRLIEHPEAKAVLDQALKGGIFLPTGNKAAALTWQLRLTRFRKAHEEQTAALDGDARLDATMYSWLALRVKKPSDDSESWGIEIKEVDTLPLPLMLDLDTMKPIEDK